MACTNTVRLTKVDVNTVRMTKTDMNTITLTNTVKGDQYHFTTTIQLTNC